MTVKELIETLQKMDENAEVKIDTALGEHLFAAVLTVRALGNGTVLIVIN